MLLRLLQTGIFNGFILIIAIFCLTQSSSGQNQFEVDSLLTRYNTTDDIPERVSLLITLSNIYEHVDIKKSYEYSNQACEESERTNEYTPKAQAFHNMGVVFFRSGVYDKATEMFLQSKKLVQDNNDLMRLVGVELNLGAVRFHLEDYNGALAHFNDALELNSKLMAEGNDVYMEQIQTFYINIASIYIEKGNYEAAIEYLEKALIESINNKDLLQQSIANNNLGEIYLKTGQFEKSHKYIYEALKVRQSENNLIGMASSYNLLTAYYISKRDIDSAEIANGFAIKYAEQVESINNMEKAYEHQANIYEQKGNYKQANEALKRYYETKRKAINESVVAKATRLQLEYNFEELQKAKAEVHFKEMVALYAILVVVVFLLIVFALLFSLWKSRAMRIKTEKETLEKDLEIKNRELTTNVMYLLKKHELINNVSGRLLRLKARLKVENRDAIQRIIFDLQGGVEPEVWEEFELRFQNVHNDFYKKLENIAPDLTPSELKICAFLRLNMNSKEISALIHQSTKSVEVKRSRIRKKLGLTNTDVNLIKYLSEL